MATTPTKTVYTVEHFRLLDGTEVEVKPLPIKRLRKAQKEINDAIRGATDDEGEEVEDYDADGALLDALINVVEVVMRGQEKCDKFLEPDDGRELLGDTVDQDTLYAIVKVATGYDFLAMNERINKMMENGVNL